MAEKLSGLFEENADDIPDPFGLNPDDCRNIENSAFTV
jgi:hypothetical protein